MGKILKFTLEEHKEIANFLKKLNLKLMKKCSSLKFNVNQSKNRPEHKAMKGLTTLRGELDTICAMDCHDDFKPSIYYGEIKE